MVILCISVSKKKILQPTKDVEQCQMFCQSKKNFHSRVFRQTFPQRYAKWFVIYTTSAIKNFFRGEVAFLINLHEFFWCTHTADYFPLGSEMGNGYTAHPLLFTKLVFAEKTPDERARVFTKKEGFFLSSKKEEQKRKR